MSELTICALISGLYLILAGVFLIRLFLLGKKVDIAMESSLNAERVSMEAGSSNNRTRNDQQLFADATAHDIRKFKPYESNEKEKEIQELKEAVKNLELKLKAVAGI